jgi:hypothetical protein
MVFPLIALHSSIPVILGASNLANDVKYTYFEPFQTTVDHRLLYLLIAFFQDPAQEIEHTLLRLRH